MSSKALESEQSKPLVSNDDGGTSGNESSSEHHPGQDNPPPAEQRLIHSTENLAHPPPNPSNFLQLPILTITHASSSDQVYPQQNHEQQHQRHNDHHHHHSSSNLDVSDATTPRRFNFGLRRFSHSHTVYKIYEWKREYICSRFNSL